MKYIRTILLITCISMLGCGYHSAGKQGVLLKQHGIQSIYIPIFKNNSPEANLEVIMTRALRDEFQKSRALMLRSQASQGHALLKVVVVQVLEQPIAFKLLANNQSLAAQFRVSVSVHIELHYQGQLIESFKLDDFEEYDALGTNLLREEAQQIALKKVAADLMEEVHDKIVEAW